MTFRIVVGVDGSPTSLDALRWAVKHAELLGGEVRAIFAWQMPFLSVPGGFDRADMSERAKQFLLETVGSVEPSPEVPLECYVAEGDPIEALIKAAGEGASLLVLGTRGRNPFRGLLLGSVSQACAANAPCPVVVVKEGTTAG